MEEYTYADVIIDPHDERVKIGKRYWADSTPRDCINNANADVIPFKLIRINLEARYPFCMKGVNDEFNYCCLIKPREPKVKYTPFDLNNKEDRNYLRNKWIRRKEGDSESPIISFDLYNGNWYTGGNSGKELLENFTFLDGTPIGKRMEE